MQLYWRRINGFMPLPRIKVKHKHRQGFEHGSPSPFLTKITVMINVPPCWLVLRHAVVGPF